MDKCRPYQRMDGGLVERCDGRRERRAGRGGGLGGFVAAVPACPYDRAINAHLSCEHQDVECNI